MRKQDYNNKAKHRSAWLALVLLMMTALPITAQNAGDRFQVDPDNGYYYEVMDATNHTVKLTYANPDAATAQAREVKLKGSYDKLPKDNQWKAYNGTVKEGEEDEFVKFSKEKGDTKKIPVVIIPEKVSYNGNEWTVVAIGSYAFINERGITKVNLPETIEAIEDCAFYQCSVKRINFPTKLKYIGWRAFYKTDLAPYIMEWAKYYGKFKYVQKEVPIEIPGATAIGPQAFEGSFSTKAFTCPKITFVGYQAFKGANFNRIQGEQKESLIIPASAMIGEATTVDATIKAMYKNLDPAVTDYRSGVESFAEFTGTVSLAEGPSTIPTGMFEKAFDNLDQFFIPLSVVTSIDERAFANAGILGFNDLSKVTKIGARAFENGALSGDFVILENVKEIGDKAFAGNSNLTGFIVKGSTDFKIGAGILEGCHNLEYIDLRDMSSADAKSKLKNLSRAFNTDANPNKTITAGLPTHTVVYLPNATDITFAAGEDVNFVKFDGTCTKLSLQDGAEYEFPYAIKASEVVYNKCDMIINKQKIGRGYNTDLTVAHYDGDNNSLTSYRDFSKFADGKHCFTIFLPYAVTLKPGICAYKLDYKYTKDYFTYEPIPEMPEYPNGYPLESGTEFYVFNSIPDGSKLEANKPYLLRITNGNSCTSEIFTANNVEIAKSPTDKFEISRGGRFKPVGFAATKAGQSYSFQGSTERIPPETYKNDANRPWVLNIVMNKNTIEGKKDIDVWRQMQYVDKGVINPSIPPFRGFVNLLPGASGAKQFMVLSEGETMGINDVTGNTDAQQGAQRIYTIDGRYVGTNFDSLPSGIYIIKGKKTLKTK